MAIVYSWSRKLTVYTNEPTCEKHVLFLIGEKLYGF